jgi:hypothetical protein
MYPSERTDSNIGAITAMEVQMITSEMVNAGMRVYYDLNDNPELMVKAIYRAMKNVESKKELIWEKERKYERKWSAALTG